MLLYLCRLPERPIRHLCPEHFKYRDREVLDSSQRLSELIKQRRVDEPLYRELVLVKSRRVSVRSKWFHRDRVQNWITRSGANR